MRRNRQDDLENNLNKSALWAVTYGDLMSYLMIFFLIMFSFSVSKRGGNTKESRQYAESLVKIQKVFGGQGSSQDFQRLAKREKEESMVQEVQQAIDKKNLSQYAQIEASDKKVRLVLANAVIFDSGSADLKPSALALLTAVGQQLKTLDNPIAVEGHTDDRPVHGGRFHSNWELSMSRAYAVIEFLQQLGIPPQRLSGVGYGQYHPVADNSTPEGRMKNRRIEIDLIRTE